MKEGVEDLWDRIMATDLEGKEVQVDLDAVDEVVNRGKNCLLVKLLTKKYFNHKAFKYTTRKV